MSSLNNKIISITLFLGLCFAPIELRAEEAEAQEETQTTQAKPTAKVSSAFVVAFVMRSYFRAALYSFLDSLFNESKDETLNSTDLYETISIPGLASLFVVGVLFTNKVKLRASRNNISAAQTKLSNYLALSPDEQRDFLLANRTAPFDFAPAFRSQEAMTNFVLSPGVQNLSPDKIAALFNHKDKSGETFFGVFLDPRVVMEQDFFRCLTKDTQRDTIFAASPLSTTIKKVLFVSLDVCRNLALIKLLNGQFQIMLPVTTAQEQADAFFEAFEQYTHRLISPTIQPALMRHLAPVTYEWKLGWLGVLGSSIERTLEASDEIIVSTYGEGPLGLAKASARVIVLPLWSGSRD